MTKTEQEAILKRFYNAWLLWARGGVSDYPFAPERGLCYNLNVFLHRQPVKLHKEERWDVEYLLEEQFIAAHLNPMHPFNDNHDEYHWEVDKRENPARVEWCASHLD